MRFHPQPNRAARGRHSVPPVRALALAACLGAIPGPGPLAAQVPPTPAQSISAGSRVYGAKGCGECHAVNGIGGTIGPDFAKLGTRSQFDIVAAMWSHLPQMAARFVAAGVAPPRLESWEAADLLAFLFWAGSATPAGNPAAGRQLFTERGCIVCHQVEHVGGVLGPALDGAASRLAPIDLAAALWNHAGAMSEEMRRRGIARPVLSGAEIRHLVAYFGAGTPGSEQVRVNVLSGNPESGRALFRDRGCVRCHQRGAGQGAPNLTAVADRDPMAFAAAMWNKSPRMMAAMRVADVAVPRLRGEEMADLAAYLGTLRYLGGTGRAPRGVEAAMAGGCTGCHTIQGRGAGPGGALDRMPHVGTRAAVIAALWNHIGQPAATMHARWQALSPEQVADLVAFFETRGAAR
jgi:mono/diheme cytochrome c family protein